mmetsp:Transcript_145536/g.362889  ORF Transcript_145536/g.362889 Transcript_145536/m.362889 type:complete len:362 (+) Transcript_145536:734-1819(+)
MDAYTFRNFPSKALPPSSSPEMRDLPMERTSLMPPSNASLPAPEAWEGSAPLEVPSAALRRATAASSSNALETLPLDLVTASLCCLKPPRMRCRGCSKAAADLCNSSAAFLLNCCLWAWRAACKDCALDVLPSCNSASLCVCSFRYLRSSAIWPLASLREAWAWGGIKPGGASVSNVSSVASVLPKFSVMGPKLKPSARWACSWLHAACHRLASLSAPAKLASKSMATTAASAPSWTPLAVCSKDSWSFSVFSSWFRKASKSSKTRAESSWSRSEGAAEEVCTAFPFFVAVLSLPPGLTSASKPSTARRSAAMSLPQRSMRATSSLRRAWRAACMRFLFSSWQRCCCTNAESPLVLPCNSW